MPEKNQKKTEVRVFLEGVQLKVVDDLIGIYGNTRSEVIRNIIQFWLNDNIDKRKEILEVGREAEEEGYTTLPEG